MLILKGKQVKVVFFLQKFELLSLLFKSLESVKFVKKKLKKIYAHQECLYFI